MSGSIPLYGLKQPIVDEVTQFISKLPDNTVFKVQLFDHRILPEWKREIGPRISDAAKHDLSNWFRRMYDPKGDTFLYDVTAAALREIEAERAAYGSVRLIIISDGINDTGGRPSNHPSWASLLPLTGSLQSGGKTGEVYWLYLEAVKSDSKSPQPRPEPPPAPFILKEGSAQGIIEKSIRPEIAFDAHPQEISVGQAVQFFPVRETAVESYAWTFSDGQRSSERTPRLVFSKPGPIDVTVTVKGPGGEAKFERKAIAQVVEKAPPPAPRADFTAHPKTVSFDEEVMFALRSNIGVDSCRWDFGDGETSTDPQPKHTYKKPGTYTVSLEVSGTGGTAKEQNTVEVTPVLAAAKFTVSKKSGESPLTVQFTNATTGDIAALRWEFGDGLTSDEPNPVHTYTDPGQYSPRLIVTSVYGAESKSAQALSITVKPPTAPMPVWQISAIAITAALLAWVLFVVPFILVPLVGLSGPRKGSKGYSMTAATGGRNFMHNLARKGSPLRFLWPKMEATIGTAKECDIRLALAQKSVEPVVARIARVSFSRRFRLIPTKGADVSRIDPGPRGSETKTAVLTSVMLKHGQDFDLCGARFQWEEPFA